MPAESDKSFPSAKASRRNNGDSANELPETWVNPKDSSVMRLIPADEFIMGSTTEEIESARQMDQDGPLFTLRHESPQCRLFVPSFYLGVFTITNCQFARFLTDVCPTPGQLKLWLPVPEHILNPLGSNEPFRVEKGRELHPAIHVSWFGADAYCRWAGMRLPTEIEWEKTARGTDGRIFPWGNEWHDDFLRWYGGFRHDDETTAPVDAFPEGRSPYGIFQMAGNVDEWCADAYEPYIYRQYARGQILAPTSGNHRIVRGGACLRQNKLEFRCAMRRGNEPAIVNIFYTGIRCACDAWRVAGRNPSAKNGKAKI
jgi:formylglycine-generating enzyme required for sulfatase activity